MTQKKTQNPSMKITVEIEDKTLLIPLWDSDCDKNITWLANEIAERYFSLYLRRPVLHLYTTSNILLCPIDRVASVITDSDKLKAVVDMWELPPIKERYIQACQMIGEVNSSVASVISECEYKGRLFLNDLSLGHHHLQPVYRVLEGEMMLTELHLAGNQMGDQGLASLMQPLQKMQNLQSLKLDANCLSQKALQTLSKVMKETPFQNLQYLSISQNSFGDFAADIFTSILHNLPKLKELKIAGCNFSEKLFTFDFCEALKARYLETLDISENQLEDLGVSKVCSCLNPSFLRFLNLSQCRKKTTGNLCPYLQCFMDKELVLTELDLAGCQLSTEDLAFLNRFIGKSSNFRKLNVSQNRQVMNSSLQSLLFSSCQGESRLEELVARGCSITSPLNAELTQTLKLKMESMNPLRKFIFTCRGLKKDEIETIVNLWRSTWKEDALVKVIGPSISLSVVKDCENN